MSISVILLIGKDINEAVAITRSIQALALPSPVHITSGEAAVLWISRNRCDVCLLDNDLPGIDGLETLVRLHQRRPDLPVIMMSSATAPELAVAAFRAGVADYVVKKPGFHDVVAQQVKHMRQGGPAAPIASAAMLRADIPEQLLRPTYQNRLRVIGRQLDLYKYRSINLLEVSGGFVVRVLTPGNRSPEALEFLDRDFPQLVASGIAARGEQRRARSTSPLLPTGYEDFLRAVGHWLDEQKAEAITVSDFDSCIGVSGVAMVDDREQTTLAPFQVFLQPQDITSLLDEAVRRRASPKPSTLFERLLARG